MMNQPYEHVNKLRDACKRMNKCRQASAEAAKKRRAAVAGLEDVQPVQGATVDTLVAEGKR